MGGSRKTSIKGGGVGGGVPKKVMGLGQFSDLRGAWQERGG